MQYLIPIVLFITAIIWHIAVFKLSPRLGLVKLNYAKKPIIASYGLAAFGYIIAAVISLAMNKLAPWHYVKLYLIVMGAMWVLGTLDDIFGTREVGGFKGHFKKLIFERKLTTGAVKALGGGLVGLAAAWSIYHGNIAQLIPAALVIPLATNILNLVDLRPGRAVAVFFFGIGVTCIAVLVRMQAPWIVGAITTVTLAFAAIDSRGKAMMGDSGANMLGAALGLTIALNTGIFYQIITIILLVAIHIYSEKHSVTSLIERNPVLRNIDRRLGVR